MKNISEQLEELMKALEASHTKFWESPAIEATEQSEAIAPWLDELTKQALTKVSTSLTHRDETGFYKCIYLAVQVKATDLEAGLRVIAKDLNVLAYQGLIHSVLAKPGSVPLCRCFGKAPMVSVFSFVLVPNDSMDIALNSVEYSMAEGEVGKELGNLDADLAEDEFWVEIRLSPMSCRTRFKEAYLHEEIQGYLDILPKGTELVSVTPCGAIQGLSLPYEVKFRNPLMKAYKEVKFNYIRMAEKVAEDRIEQFNLLDSVEYIKKEPNIHFSNDSQKFNCSPVIES